MASRLNYTDQTNVMKPTKKYLGILFLTSILVSTLSSCWVAVPSSVKVNHVETKKDNGLHKGWYKHPNHKKHKKHKHKHHDFAPNADMDGNFMNESSELYRVDSAQ